MREDIENIAEEFKKDLQKIGTFEELENLEKKYLGKKGKIKEYFRKIGEIQVQERKYFGELLNNLKREIEEKIVEKKKYFQNLPKEREIFDITLPGIRLKEGKKHILTSVIEEIKKIFISLGFTVEEGPEIETEYYNFDGLNIPSYHPARDEWDSFYIKDGVLLRTHTSPVQLRVMEKYTPPLRVISVGRCYRRDAVDRTHSHTFHQIEGFAVDEHITFGDLKGVLYCFAKKMFSPDVKMRFRPDYFPFTEPSADGAISCIMCAGEGCQVCSYTGWLEIFGCGEIHPKVLENAGYDPKKWTGFAFGMGIERIAMLKYGIDDIRLFLENDLRFLTQF
jgi:phenylalanyl-tRNA synthetase alpha chain